MENKKLTHNLLKKTINQTLFACQKTKETRFKKQKASHGHN